MKKVFFSIELLDEGDGSYTVERNMNVTGRDQKIAILRALSNAMEITLE